MYDNDEFTYIEAGCCCEINSFSLPVRTDLLPVPVDFCHCAVCRHTSGELAVQYLPFDGVPLKSSRPVSRLRVVKVLQRSRSASPSRTPIGRHNHQYINNTIESMLAPPVFVNVIEPPPSPFELSDLKQYRVSDNLTHYFCTICSAQLFQVRKVNGADIWSVAVGVLDRTEGIVQIRSHVWVGDTIDGGFANHLRAVDNIDLPRYKEGFGSALMPLTRSHPTPNGSPAANLPAFCHCRSVTFTISRPTEESTDLSAPFPDLIYSYNVTHLSKIRNTSDRKWWLAADGTRYLAGYCTCSSCRLTSGMELQAWAFIPLSNILDPRTNQPICLTDSDKRLPALKQYMSSPGKCRECCEVCGAVVFMWQSDRPELIDVSVGLFDEKAAGGALAEQWLEWHTDRISFSETALSPALVEGLSKGLKEWHLLQ